MRSRIGRWLRRILAGAGALAVVAALAGVVYQAVATRSDSARFPPPGSLLRVEGRGFHAHLRGEGGPTVVFDAPLGASSLAWELVAPALSKSVATLVFDRPGYGWSQPGPPPRSSGLIVTEMHELLDLAQAPKPYVLVGASFGALNARLFAFRYPDEVAALVLVDPAHEDQFTRLPAALRPSTFVLRLYQAGAHLGLLRAASLPVDVAGMNVLPPELQPAADAVGYRSAAVDAIVDETAALERSFSEVRQARVAAGSLPLGDRPLVVLTHQETEALPEDEAKAYAAWVELHAGLAKESSRGRQVVVERSGHFIAIDQPTRVIEAIRDAVQAVREPAAASAR